MPNFIGGSLIEGSRLFERAAAAAERYFLPNFEPMVDVPHIRGMGVSPPLINLNYRLPDT